MGQVREKTPLRGIEPPDPGVILIDATFLGLGGSPGTNQKTLGSEQAVMRGHGSRHHWVVATSGSCDRTEKNAAPQTIFVAENHPSTARLPRLQQNQCVHRPCAL